MNYILIVLFLIAAFHLCLYYCNIDFFPKKEVVGSDSESDPIDLSETKETLERQLKELKQYSDITTNG